jgi:UDP-N-acetylmuramyl pentapeptide synthase
MAAESGLSRLALVGPAAKDIGVAAKAAGLSEAALGFFQDPGEAAKWLEAGLSPGALVLVKGSRAMALERAVAALTP